MLDVLPGERGVWFVQEDFKVRRRLQARPWSRALTIQWLGVSCFAVLATLAFAVTLAQAQGRDTSQPSPRKSQSQKSSDPMNRPMDELGVTGKDDTLCSDRWYSCTSYDRQQFDQKYPGQPLKDLLRYGEPDWPDKPREGRGWQEKQDKSDSLDHHDRLDKD